MQPLSSFAWRLVSLMTRPAKPRVSPRLHIEIKRFGNPRITAYQLDRPLGDTVTPTKYSYDGESATPHRVFITEYNTELPVEPFMLVMAERLYKIPGIVRSRTPDDCGVKMANQLITIVNDRSRTDEAIEADIVAAITEVFGFKLHEVEVSYDPLFTHDRRNGESQADTIRQEREGE